MSEKNQPKAEAGAEPSRQRRLRKRHYAHALWTGVFGLLVVLGVGFVLLIGRDVRAPDWLQTRIEQEINAAAGGAEIGLGTVSLTIERADLSPRVRFQNVTVRDESGLPFASLGELSVRASFPAALRGAFLPKKVSLSGALVKLRRASDGSFDLTIGNALQASGQGATLVDLIEKVDQLLVLPELADLRELEADSLTVLYEDARAGQAWTVDGGRLRVSTYDGQLSMGADFALLGGQDYATTLEMSYDSEIGSPAARLGLTLADAPARDIASQSQALAWLGALSAPISGALRTEVDSEGALGPLNATLQIGKGVVQPEDEARPIPFERAQAYFSYDPDQNILNFSEVSVDTEWVRARGEGRARMKNGPGGWPEEMLGQFRLSNISANPAGLYAVPVTLAQADLDMRLVLDPFELNLGQLVLREAGHTVVASARADVTEAGWRIAVDAQARSMDTASVLKFWPEAAKPKTRTWIADNLLAGDLHKARLAFRAEAGAAPDLFLSFGFSEASVRFMKQMPPIEQGRGSVTIEGNRLVTVADAGQLRAPQGGLVDVAGTVFEIPDMRIKGAPARVSLSTQSTVTAALSLLDQPPFSFLSKAGQPVTLAEGSVSTQGDIALRLKKKLPASEIDFDIVGDISGVRSTSLIKERTLAAERLALRATTDQLKISGAGRIDAVPFEGEWRMPLGTPGAGSQVSGQIELSERFIDTFNIGLPPGSVSGKGQGQITIDLARGQAPRFALSSDLGGVGLRLAPLGWSKAASARGDLTVRGRLGSAEGAPAAVERLALSAAGLKATGDVRLNAGGGLDRLRLDTLSVGSWLEGPVTLTGRGRGVAPAIAIEGGRLDLRGLPSGGSGGGAGLGGAMPLSVKVNRLQVTKDIALTNFVGAFTSNNGLSGDFSGLLNGASMITGRTLPQPEGTAVQIASTNAGAAISAAGLLQNANEGALSLTLKPLGQPGSYDGQLDITNIRLRDAPDALALLSAASGIGLLEQLDGRGLMFSEVNARFRITPQTIVISKSSAVGPSLGLSADGFYNVASKQVDIQGVVSPFFAINGIGSIFTRKGEGLIGFNYTLDGPVAKPNVRVNPLSLFTPGMFREIFRRPPPQLSQ